MNAERLVFHTLFLEAAKEFTHKVALQTKANAKWQRLTYAQVKQASLKVTSFLLKRGFKKQERAALLLENQPAWPIIYIGIVQAGLTCVPIDVQSDTQELKNLIADSDAKILFTSSRILEKKITQHIRDSLALIVALGLKEPSQNCISFSEIESITPDENVSLVVTPDDVASLIYTSGTTASPKGVELTHRNICSNVASILKLNVYFSSDNVISFLPLHHTYPFMVNLAVPLCLGATVTYPPPDFRPQDLTQTVREANVTLLVGVPQFFSLIRNAVFEKIKKIPFFLRLAAWPFIKVKVKRNFGKSLRLLVSGGARLEPKIARDLAHLGFKIIEGYGLTETSPVVTFNPVQKVKFGSVGKPIPEVQIKIGNPNPSGIGEVLIKGPNVMKGYFKEPQLTASVIKDGWFHSGDLGYIDKDGYLFITGREKEVIVLSSGKTIYPEELETYYSQTPYIKEICVLQKQEDRFGYPVDFLYAVIVPDFEYFRLRNEADIRAKVRWELENLGEKLPAYKHIMGFTLTKEALARTALKKIKRYEVKEKYLKHAPSLAIAEKASFSEEDAQLLKEDIPRKIIRYFCEQLKKPVVLDSHLEIDLGIDSLTRVQLGLGLEKLLSIRIPDEFLYTVSTVREIIQKILVLVEELHPTEATASGEILQDWQEILKEPPKREITDRIQLKLFPLDYAFTFIFKNFFSFLFRICWLLQVEGKERLPKRGPFLLCPNHASYLDGFAVSSSLPFKLSLHTFFLGYSDIFKHPLIRWAVKLARFIPVDPNARLVEAMQAVALVLSHNKIVCIFPEGRRSIDGEVKEFKKGVGILLKESDIPVVPVYIRGSYQAWPRVSLLPKPYPIKVTFGYPCTAKELLGQAGESKADDYEPIADGLREAVIKLKG